MLSRGTKQVGQVTSAERGTLVTLAAVLMHWVTQYHPFSYSHGFRWSSTSFKVDDSTKFLKCMHLFAKHAKPTPSSPVLLLLDNHESHISVPVLDVCKESGIDYKTYYKTAVTDWMVSNPGKTVKIYEIPKLAAEAIPLALKLQNIQWGFEKPGIGPLNSNIFYDEDFACSVTDRCLPEEDIPTEQSISDQPVMEQPSTEENQSLEDRTSSNVEVAGPSQLESPSRSQTKGTVNVTPDLVRPYPKAGPKKLNGMKRKKGKSRILTDTPEKRQKWKKKKDKEKIRSKSSTKIENALKIQDKTIPNLADEFTSKPEKNRKISSDVEIENVSVSDETLVTM